MGEQMEPGLRERKKARTMHHLQEVALRLFTERGFDAVTIEHVAAEAEVSPSTVYRYFGTKEGLVILDEFDDPALGGLVSLLGSDVPLVTLVRTAISAIDGEHFVEARELTMVRSRMIMETPALRAAAGMRVVEISSELAVQLSVARGYPHHKALAIVAALMGCVMAALFAWYESEGATSFSACIDEALAALGELDAEPRPPS